MCGTPDESIFRETFTKVLTEEGLEVTAVDNGSDAIDAINKQAYSIAILDIHMPGADGIKVLREIMKVRPETRVIMITAYGTVEMGNRQDRIASLSAKLFLHKP